MHARLMIPRSYTRAIRTSGGPTMRMTTRAAFAVLVVTLAASAPAACTSPQDPPFDVLLTGGEVLDGRGAAAIRADVGIRGDRVEAVGSLAGRSAAKTID